MTVYKYELVQLKSRIIIWSIVISVLAVLMLPVYVQMITEADRSVAGPLGNNEFFEIIGTDFETLTSPLGVYSFLTNFILYACAINGMGLGIRIFTKEYRNNSSEFLLTKPYSRSNVFFQKFLAALTCGTIIGVTYTIASIPAMNISTIQPFKIGILILIGLSTIFIFTFFLCFGFLAGVVAPRLRSTMPLSFGAVFLTYVFAAFSYKTRIIILSFLSPFAYFNGADIIKIGGYDFFYFLLFIILSVILLFICNYIYSNKDIKTVS